MKPFSQILILVFTFFISSSCYALESMDFGPYEGKVVDADTKDPIEGAVVLVEWWRKGTWNSSFIDAQETLTDKGGEFQLSGIHVFNPWKRLYTEANLTIYKSGYKYINAGTWKKWNQFNERFACVLNVENNSPVFILKKIETIEDRKNYLPNAPLFDSKDKWKELRIEINKERNYLGLDTYN